MSIYSNNQLDNQTPNDAWYKIFQFVKEGQKILDVGCSSGSLGAELRKQKSAHVVGIDIDKKDVELARNNLDDAKLVNIERDNLEPLGKFDIIIMADVIEHLVDPVSALKRLKKLLNPEGILVFSIPNMANVTTRISLLQGRFEYKDFGLLDRTHLHFYDKQEVERVFKAAGMQIKETDCTLREIPDEILEKELEPLGIELNSKLHKALNAQEAIIYQFIGWAKPTDNPRGFSPKSTSPLDSVSKQIDELNKSFVHESRLRDEELQRRAVHIQQLDEKVAALEAKIKSIYGSKAWRVVEKTKKLKQKVSKK